MIVFLLLINIAASASGFTPCADIDSLSGFNTQSNFSIYGYYMGLNEGQASVSLSITSVVDQQVTEPPENQEPSEPVEPTRVFQTGTLAIETDLAEETTTFTQNLFRWSLSGINLPGRVTIKFTFTALMAYLSDTGLYYVPAHTFIMTLDNGTGLTRLTNQNDTFMDSIGKQSEDQNDTNLYQMYENYTYAGLKNYKRYVTFQGTKQGDTWTVGGICSVEIMDFHHLADKDFHYNSDIKVEFRVE